jgi:predicted signal transduction protein with EAL and GGDEF domain
MAEGVETEAQRLILSQEGCDQIQGHLIGMALPIQNYEAMVNAPQTRKETHKSDQADDKVTRSPLHKRIKPVRRAHVH